MKLVMVMLVLLLLLDLWIYGLHFIDIRYPSDVYAPTELTNALNNTVPDHYRFLEMSGSTSTRILDRFNIPTVRFTGQDLKFVFDFFSIHTEVWPNYAPRYSALNNTYVYDLLNVKYLAGKQPLDYEGWILFKEINTGYIYENSNVLPKAFVVGKAVTVSPESSLANVSVPFNPRELAYVVNGLNLESRQTFVQSELTLYSPHSINIHATLTEPGYLVLTEPWYKFWQARIDGTPANVYRTNHMFMGVYVPAGEHDITFEYRNSLFQLGLFISLWTLAGLLIVIVYILLFRNK